MYAVLITRLTTAGADATVYGPFANLLSARAYANAREAFEADRKEYALAPTTAKVIAFRFPFDPSDPFLIEHKRKERHEQPDERLPR